MSGASNVPATVLSSGRWLSILCPAWRDRNKCYKELHQLLDVILKNQLEQHYSFLTDAPKMQKCNSWAQLLRNLVTCSSAQWLFHISGSQDDLGRKGLWSPSSSPCHGHRHLPSTTPGCSGSNFSETNEQAEASMDQKDKFYASWSLTDTAQAPSSSVSQQKASTSDLLKHFQVSRSNLSLREYDECYLKF